MKRVLEILEEIKGMAAIQRADDFDTVYLGELAAEAIALLESDDTGEPLDVDSLNDPSSFGAL